MKCHSHPDTDAIAVCARCNYGICQACADESHYHTNNCAPLCINCNAAVFVEKGEALDANLKSKYVVIAWFIAALITGAYCVVSVIIETRAPAGESDGEVVILSALICFICLFVGEYIYIRDNRSAHSDIVNIVLFVTFFATAPISVPTQIVIIILQVKKIKRQIGEHIKILGGGEVHIH